jgi:hypothetical protein
MFHGRINSFLCGMMFLPCEQAEKVDKTTDSFSFSSSFPILTLTKHFFSSAGGLPPLPTGLRACPDTIQQSDGVLLSLLSQHSGFPF